MSPYTIVSHKFTRVLVKKQLGSRQRQLEKPVVTTGAYYGQKDNRIQTGNW